MAANRILQVLLVEELQNEEMANTRLVRRNLRDAQDPFGISHRQFILNYRLNKEAVMHLINKLNPHMIDGRRNSRIPKHIRILAALHFFAMGSYQRNIGNSYLANMSQPMISRCIKEVSNLIIRVCMKQWIKFPKNEEQRAQVKNGFRMHHHINEIIGIVDGTHVAIVKPSNDENEHVYVNRKGYHSLNVQIICDASLRILSCLVRFPSSTHDAFIWRSSRTSRTLQANYEYGDHSSRIIGDSGYPCLPWLLVPLPGPRTEQERRYNRHIKRVRSTIERCIGVLKGRYRCLLRHRTLHYAPRNAASIIMACAVLHNIAIYYKIADPEPEWDEIDQDVGAAQHDDLRQDDIIWRQRGQQSRNTYIQEYF